MSVKIDGRSNWRVMIRGTDWFVIAHKIIATCIPTSDYSVLAMLLVSLALVKAMYRF